MALACMTIFFGLLLVGLIVHTANGDVYYVASDVSDCSHVDPVDDASCNTLDHYSSSPTLRANDSVFYFMPGKHFLQHTWEIASAHNLKITGQFPRSESSEDVAVECADSNTRIRVVSGQNITVENLALLCCKGTALNFTSTQGIKLSNLTISGENELSCTCLSLDRSSGYAIADTVFSHCTYAIDIRYSVSGKLESVKFLYNYYGLWVVYPSNDNSSVLHMDRIYSSGNAQVLHLQFCSVHFSLRNSNFIDSGSFDFGQLCRREDIFSTSVIEMENCSLSSVGRIRIYAQYAENFKVSILSVVLASPI